MNRISSTIVGAAGEYHVLSQLLRRGWVAALAPDGAPNMDILATDENNEKLCAIQVKTRRDIGRDKGWHMKPTHEDMVAEDLSTCSSTLAGSRLVRPSRTSCRLAWWPAAFGTRTVFWLDTPGRGGRPHKDSNVRRLLPDYSHIKPRTEEGRNTIGQYATGWLNRYSENWGMLGLPEADGV